MAKIRRERILELRKAQREAGLLSNVEGIRGAGGYLLEGGAADDTGIQSEKPAEAAGKKKVRNVDYEIRNDQLGLAKDIYSYTYYNFVKNHNPILIGELMVKCFFTIMLQMAIIFYKFKPLMENETPVFRGDAGLNAVRLICSFVMHLYTYPNIRRGQQMI